jgi:isopropylmalate/homocitrate/citramalate synthase
MNSPKSSENDIKINFLVLLEKFISNQDETTLAEARKLGEQALKAQISDEDILKLYFAYVSQRDSEPENFGLDDETKQKNNSVYFLAEFLKSYEIPILKYLK